MPLRRLQSLIVSLPVLLALACAGNRMGFVEAIWATTLAASIAAQSRFDGGCYAQCNYGTACNPANGYCEPLPCRDACGPNEYCDESGREARCLPIPQSDLSVGQRAGDPPPPPFADGPVEQPSQ